MDYTHRMLGSEREADFAREARSRRLAAEAARGKGPKEGSTLRNEERKPHRLRVGARVASILLAIGARGQSEADPAQ
jgi:hypothetical protein